MVFCSLFFIFASTILGLTLILKIYNRLKIVWCRSQTCLVGKTTIVTGANTGIGYETALDFAKRGARVILACRDETKAEVARAKIVEETGNENVVVKKINMASFESVRSFAKNINATETQLDILVNNAGAAGIGNKKSKDGHVLLMQINYYSSFLLTILLMGLIKKTPGARIINVASLAGKYATKFNVNTMDQFPGDLQVYNDSKLCNILFTIELAKKLQGTGITTYSLHPGAVKTEIFRHVRGVLKIILDYLLKTFFKTSEEGAQTTIYCSVAKGIESESGNHFDNCKKVAPYKTTTSPGLSRKLWELTLDLVQLKPEEIQL